jgi:hypothetical protein
MSTFTGTASASTTSPGRGSARILFDRGRHPATLLRLLDVDADSEQAKTCGDCAFLYERQGNHGPRLKCRLRASKRRPGPNLQPCFPACERFEEAAGQPQLKMSAASAPGQ